MSSWCMVGGRPTGQLPTGCGMPNPSPDQQQAMCVQHQTISAAARAATTGSHRLTNQATTEPMSAMAPLSSSTVPKSPNTAEPQFRRRWLAEGRLRSIPLPGQRSRHAWAALCHPTCPASQCSSAVDPQPTTRLRWQRGALQSTAGSAGPQRSPPAAAWRAPTPAQPAQGPGQSIQPDVVSNCY